MIPVEVVELLKGKVIADIKWHKYLDWNMCVSEIIFTDGMLVDIAGNADEGRFESITLPNGDYENINDGWFSK